MTDTKDAYGQAVELQSLTFDMGMIETLRATVFTNRSNTKEHLDDGVYDTDHARRIFAMIQAMKDLEKKCLDANQAMSDRDQEILWELSGRTAEVPEIYECPFCGGEARLSQYTEANYNETRVSVECARCESVRGPEILATKFLGMCNPWRNPGYHEGRFDTLKEAEIEAVKRWNRRVCGGKAIPAKKLSDTISWPDDVPDVKPCPLCGGEPELYWDEGEEQGILGAMIVCKDCYMSGPWRFSLNVNGDGLESFKKEHPDMKVLETALESEGAMLRAAVEAWNHRVFGREAGQ